MSAVVHIATPISIGHNLPPSSSISGACDSSNTSVKRRVIVPKSVATYKTSNANLKTRALASGHGLAPELAAMAVMPQNIVNMAPTTGSSRNTFNFSRRTTPLKGGLVVPEKINDPAPRGGVFVEYEVYAPRGGVFNPGEIK